MVFHVSQLRGLSLRPVARQRLRSRAILRSRIVRHPLGVHTLVLGADCGCSHRSKRNDCASTSAREAAPYVAEKRNAKRPQATLNLGTMHRGCGPQSVLVLQLRADVVNLLPAIHLILRALISMRGVAATQQV